MSGDVESAGGRSRSATVAPRYLFAQDERRAETFAETPGGAGEEVPFGSEFDIAIDRCSCCLCQNYDFEA